MKDLNSPFKLEHFGCKHMGWNQFSNPFTKGQKNFWGWWLFPIATDWCGLGGPEGVVGWGGGLARHVSAPHGFVIGVAGR